MNLTLIVAVNKQHVIGKEGKLVFNNDANHAHFASRTQGKTVIIGRKTYESLEGLASQINSNIVVVSRTLKDLPDAMVVSSLEEAVAVDNSAFIVGGAQLFRAARPIVSTVLITTFDNYSVGDTFYRFNPEGLKLHSATVLAPGVVLQEWKRSR